MPTRAEALAELTRSGQPYELIDVILYGRPCRAFRHGPATLRALYEQARGPEEFFVYDRERLSYEDAWRRAARLATVLVEDYGVGKGDRVAITMRNYPEWPLAFMAATSIGAIAVAMNSLWSTDEMAYALHDSGARVVLADRERLDQLATMNDRPEELGVLAVRAEGRLPAGVRRLDLTDTTWRHRRETPMPAATDLDPDDDATIFYTSGSTGHPKGVVSCHRNLVTAVMNWELETAVTALLGTTPGPTPPPGVATLLAVPLFHVTGCHAIFLNAFRSRRRIVSMRRWDPARAAELIESENIALFTAPAAMTADLAAYVTDRGLRLGSLVSVGGGGANRPPAQVRRLHEAFPAARPATAWGMTETNAIGTGISGPEYLGRPTSSGRVAAVLDLAVVDPEGVAVAPGERGELVVWGTTVFRGYWNRPEDTAAVLRDRRLHTGDIAYLDDDGFVHIVDRIKDLIIRGGENIGCGAVEAALLEHPAVAEAAAYGVPDERLGEEVGATVYATADVSAEELRRFLAPRLARFAVPRYLEVLTEPLPRTGSGKILKRELRDGAAARLGAR